MAEHFQARLLSYNQLLRQRAVKVCERTVVNTNHFTRISNKSFRPRLIANLLQAVRDRIDFFVLIGAGRSEVPPISPSHTRHATHGAAWCMTIWTQSGNPGRIWVLLHDAGLTDLNDFFSRHRGC